MFVVDSPTKARAEGYGGRERELELHLEFRDLRAAYELRRFQNSPNNFSRFGPEAYAEEVARLKARVKRTLLERGDDGSLRVPAGLAAELAEKLNDGVRDEIARPEGKAWPWVKTPPPLRPYQTETVEKLIECRHGGAALSPGTGKTYVALHYVKRLGLPAVVFSPSSSIVLQTYREFVAALGKKRVGMYGNGKHDVKQDVLICTSQSLAKIKPGTPVWESFQKRKVICGDEAHTLAADTMSQICEKLLAGAPFRAFLSGTMARYDGLDVLLRGIVGPIVREMTLAQAVAGGFLTPPKFRMIEIENPLECTLGDPMRATQEALLRSARANAVVGDLANRMVAAGRPVLVLVDELDQYARLLPYLRHASRFAHGCVDKKRLAECVPKDQWESDVLDLVDAFNAGEYPILIGTSCIGIGVDVRATGAAFWMRGGKSRNELEQGIGRAVRLHPGKKDVVWFDFDVLNGGVVHKHAEERLRIYETLFSDVKTVRMV